MGTRGKGYNKQGGREEETASLVPPRLCINDVRYGTLYFCLPLLPPDPDADYTVETLASKELFCTIFVCSGQHQLIRTFS